MRKKIKKYLPIAIPYILFTFAIFAGTMVPAYADALSDITEDMINIIGDIFQAVGVLILAYSIGQLVLAFKNEDADSKSRASTQMAVGAALIIVPTLLGELNLLQYLK